MAMNRGINRWCVVMVAIQWRRWRQRGSPRQLGGRWSLVVVVLSGLFLIFVFVELPLCLFIVVFFKDVVSKQ
jgi:hypothetical protein